MPAVERRVSQRYQMAPCKTWMWQEEKFFFCLANENKYKTANFELGLASSRLWVKFKNIFDCTIMIK